MTRSHWLTGLLVTALLFFAFPLWLLSLSAAPPVPASDPALVLLAGRYEIRGYANGNIYYIAITAAPSATWPDYDLRIVGLDLSPYQLDHLLMSKPYEYTVLSPEAGLQAAVGRQYWNETEKVGGVWRISPTFGWRYTLRYNGLREDALGFEGATHPHLNTTHVFKLVFDQPMDITELGVGVDARPPDASVRTRRWARACSALVREEYTPSPTPTPTDTETATPSSTATLTSTATPTSTSTPTATATSTGTATFTPTGTNTATATPTPTGTGTATVTATPSPTDTATPSSTATATPTSTNTSTPSATVTPRRRQARRQSPRPPPAPRVPRHRPQGRALPPRLLPGRPRRRLPLPPPQARRPVRRRRLPIHPPRRAPGRPRVPLP